jgi:hypothetical protein
MSSKPGFSQSPVSKSSAIRKESEDETGSHQQCYRTVTREPLRLQTLTYSYLKAGKEN